MKLGILDLGTNTFNLIIVDASLNSQFTILLNEKIAVKLGSGGINSGIIVKEAYSRALDAIGKHNQSLKSFEVEKVRLKKSHIAKKMVNPSARVLPLTHAIC